MKEKTVEKEEVKCPWCGEMTVSKVSFLKREYGEVSERRCANCNKVLAAYLVEEGDFMSSIRKFQN
jgi:ssDNA-binding Zn-finger/Zn-ribbon topoisomerase 1